MAIETIPLRRRDDLGSEIHFARGHVSPPGNLAVHHMDPIAGFKGEDNLGLWAVTEVFSGLSLGYGFTLPEARYFQAKLDELWPTTWVGPDYRPICPPEIGDKVQELARHVKEGGIPSWDI